MKIKKYGRLCLPGAGDAILPRSMRARSPHAFLFFLNFVLRTTSVSPLECDKVTDLDREKNAPHFSVFLLLRNIIFCCFANFYLFYFFCLWRPASRRWSATRSRTLTARKMRIAFFRNLCYWISSILIYGEGKQSPASPPRQKTSAAICVQESFSLSTRAEYKVNETMQLPTMSG